MEPAKKGLKILYAILGSISLVLGTLGIFLPLLPTTPFYLLTAWLYMRSSEKLYQKVMSNKYFGTIVRNFHEDKSIPLRTKIIIVSMLWGSILFSAFFAVSAWWLRLLLFAIAIGVTIHVLSYKTKKVKQ
ncbi:MAG: YbaN family protein [Bacteroidales bacterium]|nr:YbaN family protein [Bacteroidales bacterium]